MYGNKNDLSKKLLSSFLEQSRSWRFYTSDNFLKDEIQLYVVTSRRIAFRHAKSNIYFLYYMYAFTFG